MAGLGNTIQMGLAQSPVNSGDYQLKDLFNKSGGEYRSLKMKDKLPTMTAAAAIDLLAGNGRLCKRPIVTDGKVATVGFKEDDFAGKWG